MKLKEYYNQLLIIENDYNLKKAELSLAVSIQKNELLSKYFESNLKYKVGDIVSDGDIYILVDRIELHGEYFNGKPTAFYCGRSLNKNMTLKKRGGGILHIESEKAI